MRVSLKTIASAVKGSFKTIGDDSYAFRWHFDLLSGCPEFPTDGVRADTSASHSLVPVNASVLPSISIFWSEQVANYTPIRLAWEPLLSSRLLKKVNLPFA